MKSKIYLFLAVIIAISFAFTSCKKEKNQSPPETPYIPLPHDVSSLAGLGPHHGYPTGTAFHLPSNITIIGSIRGGIQGKNYFIDKDKYQGPFPYVQEEKSWVDYGTGTYINLYIKFYNSLATSATLTIPGGLIFCDSLDIVDSIGIYQKGYIMQSLNIAIPAQDTAFAHIKAYCLNMHLMPSNYNAVYYIGPITNNVELNHITTIMAPKQYPFGEESSIQSIVWKVTDNGQVLDSVDIAYLNSLP
jgi:hypothetical protein